MFVSLFRTDILTTCRDRDRAKDKRIQSALYCEYVHFFLTQLLYPENLVRGLNVFFILFYILKYAHYTKKILIATLMRTHIHPDTERDTHLLYTVYYVNEFEPSFFINALYP